MPNQLATPGIGDLDASPQRHAVHAHLILIETVLRQSYWQLFVWMFMYV